MRPQLTALVLTIFTFGGCHAADDVYVGTFERLLKHADFQNGVELDDRESIITLELFRGVQNELLGEIILDGDLQIYGADVWDFGNDPYPVHDLALDDRELKGKVDIPDLFLNAHFKGVFRRDFTRLALDVRRLGEIVLFKVDQEPEEAEGDLAAETAPTADTALPLD